MHLPSLSNKPRLCFALAVAGVGFVVSLAMAFAGGPTAQHLPGVPFHIGAFFGAGLAGWLCLGAFGLAGRRGAASSFGGGFGMTLLGAVLGTWVCTIVTVCAMVVSAVATSGFKGLEKTVTLFDFAMTVFVSPVLGLIAILDAAESIAVLLVWGLGMAALHFYARILNARGPIPRISLRKKPSL